MPIASQTTSSSIPTGKPKSRVRRLGRLTGLAITTLAILAIDGSPDETVRKAPVAQDATQAKALFDRLQAAADTGKRQTVAASWPELASLSLLAGRMTGVQGLRIERGNASAMIKGSIALPLGLWINGMADLSVDPDTKTPVLRGRLGDLPLPAFVMHLLYGVARAGLSVTGREVPSLDEVAQNVSISDLGISAEMNLKEHVHLVRSLGSLGSALPAGNDVATHYCRLAKAQAATPVGSLSETLGRAFSEGQSEADAPAILMAVAMITVSSDVGNLSGVREQDIADCRISRPRLALHGRTDLAKHWALSAALSATLGETMSESLGAWKEIADSREGGSGFSYVDLAADRSGMMAGTAIAAADRAGATMARLASATDDQLLPVSQLALAEGMSEADYLARYKSIDSREHQAIVSRIDAALAKAGLFGS